MPLAARKPSSASGKLARVQWIPREDNRGTPKFARQMKRLKGSSRQFAVDLETAMRVSRIVLHDDRLEPPVFLFIIIEDRAFSDLLRGTNRWNRTARQMSLDSRPWELASEPNGTVTINGLSDGQHSLSLRLQTGYGDMQEDPLVIT